MKSTRRRQDLDVAARRARRRRLPEPVDQPDRSEDVRARRRSGRGRHGQWRRDLDQLVQPADGAALPRRRHRRRAVPRVQRAAGERLGVHREPRQRRLDRLPRLASGRRRSSTATPRRIRAIPTSSTAPAATQVSRYRWSTRPGPGRHADPDARHAPRRAHAADRVLAGRRRDLLYYAANVAVRDDERRPDAGRRSAPTSAHPASGHAAERRRARRDRTTSAGDHRGAIYALAPSYKTTRTLWAGTDDGKLWVHARRRRALDRHHAAGASRRGARSRSSTRRASTTTTVYASVSRLRVDDLAPYIYRTHDGGKTWTRDRERAAAGPGQRGARGSGPQGPALREHRDRRVGVVRRRRLAGSRCSATCRTRRCATSSSTATIWSSRRTAAASGSWTTSRRCAQLHGRR